MAAIADDHEERDLITRVLFTPLHDAGAVRYRQEVFRDLENPALFGQVWLEGKDAPGPGDQRMRRPISAVE